MSSTNTINQWVENGLRFIGIWPNSSYGSWYRFLYLICMTIVQMCQYYYIYNHIKIDEISLLMESLSTTMTYTLTFLKFISLWFNRRVFNDILSAMKRDWQEHKLNEFHWAAEVMKKTAILSDRCTKCIMSFYPTVVILYGSTFFLSLISTYHQLGIQDRIFLLPMDFPFDGKISPIYEIILALQFIHQMSTSITIGILNVLILTLILHVGGRIDIIRQELIGIVVKQEKQESILPKLYSLIERHQRIISLSNDIERLFSSIALMQFLSNTVVSCFIGFILVVAFGSVNAPMTLIKFIGFYSLITLEAFIFCFAGEYLSDKSKAIGDAAYDSLWYEMKPKEIRILTLLILRSQRRLTLTIGKFMVLSLERFTVILKASASYVSVLHAFY